MSPILRVSLAAGTLIVLSCFSPAVVAPAGASGTDSSLAAPRSLPIRFEVLLQTLADVQPERSLPGHNGFTVSNARLGIRGRVDERFSYLVRGNFVSNPVLVDAFISFDAHSNLTLTVGRFLIPFSAEFLRSSETIDFVRRSQAVSTFIPDRQLGFQARAHSSNRRVDLAAGLFNGNEANSNDNEDFLFAARAEGMPFADSRGVGVLSLGASFLHSHDFIGPGGSPPYFPSFRGKRRIVGADLRWERAAWMIGGEWIAARFDYESRFFPEVYDPFGGHVTLGCRLSPTLQTRVRLDRFSRDGGGPDRDLILLGFDLAPSPSVRMQADYVIPTETGPEHHQLLLKFQIAFRE